MRLRQRLSTRERAKRLIGGSRSCLPPTSPGLTPVIPLGRPLAVRYLFLLTDNFRSSIRILELPLELNPSSAASSSTHDSILFPRSTSPRLSSLFKPDRLPTRRQTNTATDSSDSDTVSSAPLPLGKPLPERTSSPSKEGLPVKKARPTGPASLPTGPPTIITLRILLEPEHVDLNRPKQLFDLLRKRDGQEPRVRLGPLEIKEVLEKMRRVNEIWLRTMGEDEGNVQCLAGWLRLFVSSNEPKQYEGIVAPAIWVGLAFHLLPPFPSTHAVLSTPLLPDRPEQPISSNRQRMRHCRKG